jgi:hypothetical protein
VDEAGNTYVAGSVGGTVSYGAGGFVPGGGDAAIWKKAGDSTPNAASWDGLFFGPTSDTAAVGEWRIIDGADSFDREEKIVLGVTPAGTITGQIFATGTWSALPFAFASGVPNDQHGFDVAYEGVSGDAIVVWHNGTTGANSISFRIWNGIFWTSELTFTTPLVGAATNLRLAANPNSDQMILQVTNANSHDYALVWNGIAWTNPVVLGTNTTSGTTDAAVTFSSLNGQGMVVYDNNNANGTVEFRIWNGTAWSTQQTLASPAGISTADIKYELLVSDPDSNRIGLAVLNEMNQIWLAIWDGNISVWPVTQQVVATTNAARNDALNMAMEFLPLSGTLIVAYGVNNQTAFRYRTIAAPVGALWSGEQLGPDLGAESNSMVMAADSDENRVMLAVQDDNSDLHYVQFDDSSWGGVSTQETETGEVGLQPFLFLYDQSPSVDEAYLAKFDPNGTLVWARVFGSAASDSANAVTVDADGNIYVSGTYNIPPYFGPLPIPNDFDPGSGVVSLPGTSFYEMFVSKFDSDGELIWAQAFSGSNSVEDARGIAVDSLGNVHVAGVFSGPVDFDPTPQSFFVFPGVRDTFIAKLDSRGELTWVRAFAGLFGSTDDVESLALDSFGNVYVSGRFTGLVDFDPGQFSDLHASTFGDDAFVVKLDLSGTLVWARTFGDDYNDRALGMFVGEFGEVLLTGSFRGFMDIDPGTGFFELASNGLEDVFVVELSAAGDFVWARSFGGPENDAGRGVTKDFNNNVYLTGDFRSAVDFDPGAGESFAASNGETDVFVVRLDNAHNFSWVKTVGANDADSGREIRLDALGFIYVAGVFRATVDFDPGVGTSNLDSFGAADGFLLELAQDFIFNTSGVGPDDIVLRRNGELIEIYDRNLGLVVESRVLNQILGVQLIGQDGEADSFTVDFQFGGTFQTIHPLVFDGGSGGGDSLSYIGTTREVTVLRPAESPASETRFTWDGKLFEIFDVESYNVTRASSFRLQTQGGSDLLDLTPAVGFNGAPATRINGTSGGVSIGSATFDNVDFFVLDAGFTDVPGQANDEIYVAANALKAAGLFDVNVSTGIGDDRLIVDTPDLILPVAGGVFRFRAGGNNDRLEVIGDVDWRINNSRVLSSLNDGRVFFSELENAT